MPREFKSFFKKAGGGEGQKCYYPTRLDTYGCGCQHDCSYCYAKSLLSFRNLWKPNDPSVAPLEEKKKIIANVHIPSISVCEDVDDHYNYWKEHFNPKRNDCCNLRGSNNEELVIKCDKVVEQGSLFD